jgi:non-specific serine/threonine protein kinase
MESLTGSEINGYKFADRIGSGGFGAVYRAYQAAVDREVAIKVVLPEFASHPEFVKRFEAEARVVAKLEHPHIVPLHDFWQDDSGAYLVMRWLRGGSLREQLDHGSLSLEEISHILDQITDALDAAHEHGVIHRDLKPENILLDDRGDAYLTDFGIAKDLAAPALTAEDQVMGSAAYLAPEQAKAEPVSPQTDLYALGLILYELLTSTHPFPEMTLVQLVHKHLNEPLPSLSITRPDLPKELDDVIQRATAKEARDRFPNAQSFKSAFNAAVFRYRETALPGREVHPGRLPVQPTIFIGREQELKRVSELIDDPDCRLLTLVGPGGIGKTRLALKAAEGALEPYHDGVYFVPLSPVGSSDYISSAIAKAIDMTFFGEDEPRQQLNQHLRNKKMLLVLDSFEHLQQGATQIADLLESCPSLKVLVTSQERLNLQVERAFDLQAMPIPTPDEAEAFERAPAVQIFLQSARRVDAGFSITDEDRAPVIRICQLASGMPLGIELAAAWVSVLSCEEIALEIERSLDFLVTSMRDVPERHRSMKAVLEHSWKLLSSEEQDVFRALAVFRGGFSKEAAREVAGASLMILAKLVDKSMLRRGAQDNYEIQELLRQFGFEKLQESGTSVRMQDAHLDYFLEFAEQAEQGLRGPKQTDWFNLVEREHDNLRHALSWALERSQTKAEKRVRVDKGIRLAAAMGQFWDTRGHIREASEWLQSALEASERPSVGRAKALLWAGLIAMRRSDYRSRISYVDESLKLSRELDYSAGIAEALFEKAHISRGSDFQLIEQLCSESSVIWRELADQRGVARALGPLARAAREQNDFARASELFQQSLALFREVGDVREIAGALWNLSEVALREGDFQAAGGSAREGLAHYQGLGDKHGIATMLRSLGEVSAGELKMDESQVFYQESITIFGELRDERCKALSLIGLGRVALHQGQAERAARLSEESLAVFRKSEDRNQATNALALLARAAFFDGNPTKAVQLIKQGLEIQRKARSEAGLAQLIELLASALVIQAKMEKAVVMWGAAETMREAVVPPQTPDELARREREVAELERALGPEQYQRFWDEGRGMAIEQVIEFALAEATGI